MAKRPATKFDKLDLAELVQLRDEIETALNGKIAIEREELAARINQLAALQKRRSKDDAATRRAGPRGKRGNGAASAKPKVHPLAGRKAEPKFRGPNGETWAGRGLAPKWLTALEAKGKKRESFLIKS